MEYLLHLHNELNALVWGPPMLLLLIGSGLLLTFVTRGVQFVRFGFAMREVLGKIFSPGVGEGTVRPFQALAASLASTVGVGNIAGVATAISLGGPGALFWMWFSGVVGMATKYAEITLALRYREPDEQGVMRGGAMYILAKNFNLGWLGAIFALLVALAAFGIGNMVQANSVADAVRSAFGVPAWGDRLDHVRRHGAGRARRIAPDRRGRRDSDALDVLSLLAGRLLDLGPSPRSHSFGDRVGASLGV